jgi:hypothetical protein
MLRLLDLLLTLVHLLIIGFNLFGWIFPRARKFHLAFIILTALSWFVLGIWYGIGYCPVTDWQWRIKEQLGEQHLPPSFITYFAEKIFQTEFSDALVNTLTLVLFLAAAVVSIYLNFFRKVNV